MYCFFIDFKQNNCTKFRERERNTFYAEAAQYISDIRKLQKLP